MTKAEQFIRNYTNHCSNEIVPVKDGDMPFYHEWLTPEQALRAVEIEREELLEKACMWLRKNTFKSDWPSSAVFIEFFVKAMKGE